jgi:hypothetical protein
MLSKPLLIALLAACGVPSNTATTEPPREQPDDKQPPDEPPQEDQHFCCEKLSGSGSGTGCVFISEKQAALCDKLLYCGSTYEKDGDKVTCL